MIESRSCCMLFVNVGGSFSRVVAFGRAWKVGQAHVAELYLRFKLYSTRFAGQREVSRCTQYCAVCTHAILSIALARPVVVHNTASLKVWDFELQRLLWPQL